MTLLPLLGLELRREPDVVLARQRARELAGLLGLDTQDGVRLATAVSEVARNAHQYAGGGRLEFLVDTAPRPPVLLARLTDEGPGIPRLQAVLDGDFQPSTGPGLGLAGARRLMDVFDVQTSSLGTQVTLGKRLPRGSLPPTPRQLEEVGRELAQRTRQDGHAELQAELQAQHRELLRTLAELRARQEELAEANRELEETNRGVVALYAELDARAEMSQRASELKSRFMRHLGHEFRTPLGSMRTLAQLLLDRSDGPLTAEQEYQVRLIHHSAGELLGMVNDLLDLARAESGRLPVTSAPVQLEELFSSLRAMLRPLARDPAVELVFEEPPPLPPLWTDMSMLSQVLRNFISNALKFTARGEVRVSAHAGPEEGWVRLAVRDTGPGIAPEDQGRIFEEFVQVPNPLQGKVKGTGLGLPLARRLAEVLGGRVEVESALGQGSTFSVLLPLRMPGAEGVGGARARGSSPAAGSGRARATRLLVVEDDAGFRYGLRRSLEALGFEVVEAPDGHAAAQALKTGGLDGVLLDLVLPDASGWQVLERVRAAPGGEALPVVVVTSEPLGTQPPGALSRMQGALRKDALAGPEGTSRLAEALEAAGLPPPGMGAIHG